MYVIYCVNMCPEVLKTKINKSEYHNLYIKYAHHVLCFLCLSVLKYKSKKYVQCKKLLKTRESKTKLKKFKNSKKS